MASMTPDIDHEMEIAKLQLEIQRGLTNMYGEAARAFTHMHTYAQQALQAQERLLEHLRAKEGEE